MNTVEVRKAVKYYEEKDQKTFILNDFNMTVKRGSIFALLGASGCGKTTLLSCIIGSMNLNSGSINVKGCSGLKIPGNKIGYMPQQIALIEEFTIKEMIYYFGRISGMTDRKLENRFEFLKKLLDLPPEGRYIVNCSGGEQRRVSFAVAILHEPELLILDEPTVGLDPILRSEIWEFLIKSTSTSNLSVIITTHYIEEASQANCIGLMRNGVLLAEDSPSNILQRFHVDNLQDAFLQLSTKQENNLNGPIESETQIEFTEINTIQDNAIITEEQIVNTSTKYGIKMKALVKKNLIQMLRQPAGLIVILCLPFFLLFLFYTCIGLDPIGLQFAIVSDEIFNYEDCYNQSLITTNVEKFECSMHQISCRFILQFNDSIAEKIYYHSFQNAYDDVKKGKLSGIIYFASNFTESLEALIKDESGITDGTYDNGKIQIFMDRTDQLITFYLDKKLHQTYIQYSEKLMRDCRLPIKSGNIPINLMEPVFGSFDGATQDSMAPCTIMTFLFFFTSLSAATVFITDRSTGVWNRSVIAGISSWQFLSSHILTQSLVVLFHFFGCIIGYSFFINTVNNGSYILVMILIILVQYIGVFVGFLISLNSKGFIDAAFQLNGLTLTSFLLCGSAWPKEGMPSELQYFANILPFTLPSSAIINITVKGYTLMHKSILIGFGVAISWIIILILLCITALKFKKFSKNA